MKKILRRSLALLLIVIFTLGSVWALDRVLLIKRYDGVQPMESFYAQEPGTVDVLLMGNSHRGVHVDTATLWREYGITSYIRGSAQQLIWQSYYLMEETLKYETPKVMVFNVLSMQYGEPQSEAYNRLNLDLKTWRGCTLASTSWRR